MVETLGGSPGKGGGGGGSGMKGFSFPSRVSPSLSPTLEKWQQTCPTNIHHKQEVNKEWKMYVPETLTKFPQDLL